MKTHFIFDWETFGIGITLFKNAEISDYLISLDIQLLFLNIWIQLASKYKGVDFKFDEKDNNYVL